MSALATSDHDDDKSNIEQLKTEAVALEGGGQYYEALAKFEKLLAKQQSILGDGHPDAMETMQ
jgi:hypothetical protein